MQPAENISLAGILFQQLASTRFHRRRSGLRGLLKKLLHLGAQTGIVLREVGQALKSKSLHNRTAIIEVALQCCRGALAFPSGEAKPRNHGREVPAQLDLFRFGEQAEEFYFVAIQEPRFLRKPFPLRPLPAFARWGSRPKGT